MQQIGRSSRILRLSVSGYAGQVLLCSEQRSVLETHCCANRRNKQQSSFLPGSQAVESDFCPSTGATSVAQMDGSSQSLIIGGEPETSAHTQSFAAVADVRMYLHSDDADGNGSEDGPLTAAQIYTISRNQAPASLNDKCLPYTSPFLQDTRFKDHLGHDCLVSACWNVRFCTRIAFDSAAKLFRLGECVN